jgi:hypothetical protein
MANIPLNFDVLLLAPLALLLGITAFWLLQLSFVEIQKRVLHKLRHRHEAFCRFTNFIGILFQTICHAFGYTVTRSGIAQFHVTVHYGTVEPKKVKTGVFAWIANSFLLFGPFFIPAGLVLLCSYFIIGKGFLIQSSAPYTFVEYLTNFGVSMSTFAESFVRFLIRIDLFNPLHLGFLIVLLFFGLGIRPSYIGEERKVKIDMIYDLKNIKNHLIQKPLYLLVFILILYALYFLSLFLQQTWYATLFTIFGWISLTAIIALLLTFLVILLIKTTDEIAQIWKALPFITLPASYIIARVLFMYYRSSQVESVSLLVMMLCTLVVTILLIKYKKTNRFKTATKMKHMTVEDGKKRASKKRTD